MNTVNKIKLPPYDPSRDYKRDDGGKGSWQWTMQWVEKIERDNRKTGHDLLMVAVLPAAALRWLLENRPDFFEDEHQRTVAQNMLTVK
jgi:hypothetical protein